jgi:SAM-dependent methyltransferase
MKIIKSLFSNKASDRWFRILVSLAVLMIVLFLYKQWVSKYASSTTEGFTQNEKYVMKRERDSYDDFYTQIYDYLQLTQERSKFEMKHVIESTQPDKEFSRFLDIGCGTGCLVKLLHDEGYYAQGIDQSKAMIKTGLSRNPSIRIAVGDAEDTSEIEKSSMTHITCMNFTIYAFEDKIAFFRNCYYWLTPGGYLFLHTVHRNKFDPIVPAGKPILLKHAQTYAKTRITDTAIDFVDFKYKSSFDFSNVDDKNVAVQTETFTDKSTGNIRQNENTFHMESEQDILKKAGFAGFILQSKFQMKDYNQDEHQTVYILEKNSN